MVVRKIEYPCRVTVCVTDSGFKFCSLINRGTDCAGGIGNFNFPSASLMLNSQVVTAERKTSWLPSARIARASGSNRSVESSAHSQTPVSRRKLTASSSDFASVVVGW